MPAFTGTTNRDIQLCDRLYNKYSDLVKDTKIPSMINQMHREIQRYSAAYCEMQRYNKRRLGIEYSNNPLDAERLYRQSHNEYQSINYSVQRLTKDILKLFKERGLSL